jgi:phytoene dehydrogenase-like protein
MKKSIIIIGSGMGGLAAGIYGQLNGFDTTIYEAHNLPGGQCTGWTRKGYVFDACLHSLNGFKQGSRVNNFWQELGAMPCETVSRNEFVSAVFPDGTYVHDYFDVEKLEQHLKNLSPDDTELINEFINAIKSFLTEYDWFGISNFGSFPEKMTMMPFFLSKLKYFKYTMGSFAGRFKNPYLKKTIPLIRNSIPEVPLFGYLAEFSSCVTGDILWPRGGGFTLSKNMAENYVKLGGTIRYHKKAVKIITEKNRASGIELEDGTQHKADFIISNADGRKTIFDMLGGQYINRKVSRYCKPYSDDNDVPWSVLVCLGVKRDLSKYPSSLIMFLEQPEIIAGKTIHHLHMQIYGFDKSMASEGKGVIKVELFCKPSHFSRFYNDKASYKAEKSKIAEQVITLLEKQFSGIREDIEVIETATLHTWERFMGGTQGFNNFPKKYKELTDIRNVLDFIFGLNKMFTLPGLKNFFFTGQWVTSMGSLFSNALTGKTVIQKICRQCGIKFKK